MKRTHSTRLGLAAAALGLALGLASCQSAPVAIPADMDAPTMIQKAQEASDASDYKLALRYYQALVDSWGGDPAYLATGEYEIAFITYKQGDRAKAKELFTAFLARYDAPGGEALPERYKILAQKLLDELR